MKAPITVETTIDTTVEAAWKCWTTPTDVMQWNKPADDWHSPKVEIYLQEEGEFFFRMEAKDGSEGFDHFGKYDKIVLNKLIEYTGGDGRKTSISFVPAGATTTLIESFEPEPQTPADMQRDFCQAVLNSFKKYTEYQKTLEIK